MKLVDANVTYQLEETNKGDVSKVDTSRSRMQNVDPLARQHVSFCCGVCVDQLGSNQLLFRTVYRNSKIGRFRCSDLLLDLWHRLCRHPVLTTSPATTWWVLCHLMSRPAESPIVQDPEPTWSPRHTSCLANVVAKIVTFPTWTRDEWLRAISFAVASALRSAAVLATSPSLRLFPHCTYRHCLHWTPPRGKLWLHRPTCTQATVPPSTMIKRTDSMQVESNFANLCCVRDRNQHLHSWVNIQTHGWQKHKETPVTDDEFSRSASAMPLKKEGYIMDDRWNAGALTGETPHDAPQASSGSSRYRRRTGSDRSARLPVCFRTEMPDAASVRSGPPIKPDGSNNTEKGNNPRHEEAPWPPARPRDKTDAVSFPVSTPQRLAHLQVIKRSAEPPAHDVVRPIAEPVWLNQQWARGWAGHSYVEHLRV